MVDRRYPIGPFEEPATITPEVVDRWIGEIEAVPAQLRQRLAQLSESQLETRYREGGWTIRQVIHHMADSHMNSLVRFKWALTEDRPTIKTYHEERWAELVDYRECDLETTAAFLDALHARWVVLLRGLTPEQLDRRFVHPDSGEVSLATNIGVYSWHARHHLAHIDLVLEPEFKSE